MPSPKPTPNPTLEDASKPLLAEGVVLCDTWLAGGVINADAEVVVVWDVSLVDGADEVVVWDASLVDGADEVEVEMVEVVTEDSVRLK